jgi:predicted nucleic-acid-binding Zn-ribbon protein
MACKKCASENQQNFPGEMAVAFHGIKRVNLSPIHIRREILICLDCGYTELVIPELELKQLREGMEVYPSKGAE